MQVVSGQLRSDLMRNNVCENNMSARKALRSTQTLTNRLHYICDLLEFWNITPCLTEQLDRIQRLRQAQQNQKSMVHILSIYIKTLLDQSQIFEAKTKSCSRKPDDSMAKVPIFVQVWHTFCSYASLRACSHSAFGRHLLCYFVSLPAGNHKFCNASFPSQSNSAIAVCQTERC